MTAPPIVDYKEPLHAQRARERRERLIYRAKWSLAGLAFVIVYFGSIELQRAAESAIAQQEREESERTGELIALHRDAMECGRGER